MNKNYVFNSNKKLLHVYICCARPNGRTVRHITPFNDRTFYLLLEILLKSDIQRKFSIKFSILKKIYQS